MPFLTPLSIYMQEFLIYGYFYFFDFSDRFRQIFKFFRSIIAAGLNRACLGEYFAKELKVKDSQRK